MLKKEVVKKENVAVLHFNFFDAAHPIHKRCDLDQLWQGIQKTSSFTIQQVPFPMQTSPFSPFQIGPFARAGKNKKQKNK